MISDWYLTAAADFGESYHLRTRPAGIPANPVVVESRQAPQSTRASGGARV